MGGGGNDSRLGEKAEHGDNYSYVKDQCTFLSFRLCAHNAKCKQLEVTVISVKEVNRAITFRPEAIHFKHFAEVSRCCLCKNT